MAALRTEKVLIMRLFKYFHPDRTDVLRDRKICFSSPLNLNDPFEMRPTFDIFESAESLKSRAEASIDARLAEELSKLPDYIKQRLTHTQLVTIREGVLAGLPAIMDANTPAFRDEFYQKMAAMIGMLCLTERQDDILMWAHYACSHEGFVIEFDPASPFFDQRRNSGDELRHLRQVVYAAERPRLVLDSASDMSSLLTKSDHWAYEREWRMMVALSDAYEVKVVGPKSFHLFEFPPEAILSVTLGCRTSEAKCEEIRKVLRTDPKCGHITIYKSVPNESHFRLNIEPA